ncbi:MAG: SDR family NAD(P)-dependent oxidoreductase [Polyangiaceae bacterium]
MSTGKAKRRQAVVTGAASGIGRALVRHLAKRGAEVVCADIDGPGAERVAAEINANGGRAAARACDVSSLSQVEALARFAEDYFGTHANYVVNNAGIGVGGSAIGELSIADWKHTLDVNLWGVIHGCHAFVPGLRRLGTGSLINIASSASFVSGPRMAAYNVSKAGVMSLSETLAAELSDSRVAVSVVCPTFVKTAIGDNPGIRADARRALERGMQLTGRSAERVADHILRAHDAGEFVILPQIEARMLYWLKRRAPRLQLGLNRLLARAMSRSLG